MSSATNRKESSSTAAAVVPANGASLDPSSKASKSNNPFQQQCNAVLQRFPLLQQWQSRKAFLEAQGHFILVLLVAYCVNNWPVSYARELNHSNFMFWFMSIVVMGGVAYSTLKHETNKRGVQLLSRAQTEEWKGWMQFAFIMVSS